MNSLSARKPRSGRRAGVSAFETAEAIHRLCYRRPVDKIVLGEVLELLRGYVPFEAATLYLVTAADGQFEELISVGRPVEPLEFLPLGSGSGLSGWAAYSGKPILLKDRSRGRHFNPDTDQACFLSLPLPLVEQPIGVLNLGSAKPEGMNEKHVELLTQLAPHLAAVLERVLGQQALDAAATSLSESDRRLRELEEKFNAGSPQTAITGVIIAHIHEINEQLSVIVGNIECLLVEPAIGNQLVLTRLRRVEEAALKLKTRSRKLLKLSHPRKQSVMESA